MTWGGWWAGEGLEKLNAASVLQTQGREGSESLWPPPEVDADISARPRSSLGPWLQCQLGLMVHPRAETGWEPRPRGGGVPEPGLAVRNPPEERRLGPPLTAASLQNWNQPQRFFPRRPGRGLPEGCGTGCRGPPRSGRSVPGGQGREPLHPTPGPECPRSRRRRPHACPRGSA